MIVQCASCSLYFNDEFRWTICPHETFAANNGSNSFAHRPESYLSEFAPTQNVQETIRTIREIRFRDIPESDIITMPSDDGSYDIYQTVRRHPPIETLAAYVEGSLRDTDCLRVSEHLNFCPRCYELVSETREVLRWMEDSRKSQAEVRDEYQELYSRQQKDRTGDRNMETPSVGRIVHYVLDDPPRHLAAIITEVLNSVGSVNLSAFPPLRGSVPFYAVQYSARMSPGTWHYPERVTTSSDHESEEVPAPRTAGE